MLRKTEAAGKEKDKIGMTPQELHRAAEDRAL